MSRPVKLLFDECLGKPLIADIQQLLSWDDPPPIIHHLLDYFQAGTPDLDWIPAVAREGWIIVTSDRGSKSSRMKLPQICLEYKISHILMGPSILHIKQYQKALAVVAVWEQIKASAFSPPGSRFALQWAANKRPTLKRLL